MSASELKSLVVEKSGMTLEHLAESAKRNLDSDGCGNLVPLAPGLKVFWSTNPNYQQGPRNGGGIGLYARAQLCGMTDSIRIQP